MARKLMHILPSTGTGGGQTAVYGMIQGLREFEHILVTHKSAASDVPCNGKVRKLFSDPVAAINRERPDFVHFSGIISNGTLDVRRLNYHPPIVWVAQTTGARPFPGVTRACACSEFLKRSTKWSSISPGFDVSSVTVVPNAAMDMFFEAPARVSNVVIGRHCRFDKPKFSDNYWNVLRDVYKRVPTARFVIIGDGPYRRKAWSEVEKLGIDHVTHFTGNLPPVSVARLLSTFRVYFHSTGTWQEGWSLAISEAMAKGIPIVCDRKGGNPETVDGGSGFECTKHDCMVNGIVALATDDTLWKEMSAGARARALSRMSVKAMCDGYRRVFM